jgi:5,10-methylene-tetrahydrofolate dehydrogenase/methenyl tetrahydrofolate cyclohydrolase
MFALWLSQHIKQENVLKGVSLEKDVDGLNPINLGRLSGLSNSDPTFVPCTPLGCMELLARLGIEVEKKRVVVIGCSSVVGFPTAILLQVSVFFQSAKLSGGVV